MEQNNYDVIIVGLGCFGLGASYYLSKQGLRVLGFDKNHGPGTIGSGTVGYGRIWRYLHNELRYAEMQKEAQEIFQELEQKIGKQILVPNGLLYIKPIGHPDIKEFMKYGDRLSAEEINLRWPAFKVPSYLEGVFTLDAGVAQVRYALEGFKEESKKQGADLRYSQKVANIDHENGIVILENGEQYTAKNIVVTCGATQEQFYQTPTQFKVRKQMINCYYLEDNLDLPAAFLMEGLKEANGIMVFGTLDGENFSKYKIGNECDDLDAHLMMKIMNTVLPAKISKITHIMPCFYSLTQDEEFIFEKHGNTIYAFGCNGRGFKHMPYHGKRIYHLVKGDYQEANKYMKKIQIDAKL